MPSRTQRGGLPYALREHNKDGGVENSRYREDGNIQCDGAYTPTSTYWFTHQACFEAILLVFWGDYYTPETIVLININ